MDESQITGTASSYARKYALNGLFLIDDNKDPDTNEAREQANNAPAPPPVMRCAKCGREIVGGRGQNGVHHNAEDVAKMCGGLCPQCYTENKRQQR